MNTLSSELSIREAKPKDAPGIAEVQYQSWLTTYPSTEAGITESAIKERLDRVPLDRRTKQWTDRILGSNKIWVALFKGRVVGWVSIHQTSKPEVAIYLLADFQSQGIGSLLMTKALTWFGNDRDLYLTVATYNQKAIGLYEKFGFEMVGPVEDVQSKRLDAVAIPQYEMVRKAKHETIR